MYTIYSDGKLLYAPHLFHEGCGVLSPKLTVELNKAGSLDFTLPPTNSLYDDIKKLTSHITVHQDGIELFEGRVLHDEKDFYKQKKVYCEGELAYLLDSKQRPYTFSGTVANLFKQYISNHNSRVEADKQFTVGNITVEGDVACENYNYPSTFDEINTQIIDVYGGYLKIRKSGDTRYIDLLASSGELSSQTIEFGINLLDISEYITAEDIFTVLIPLGAVPQAESTEGETVEENHEKLTIADKNGGKDYLEDSSAIALFGRIERTEEWSDVEDPAELLELGQALLNQNIELAMTLTVKAVDMHLINVDVAAIRLGDWVRVISLPHGLDRQFQCTKITYDLTNPDQTEYVFGVNVTSLTEQQLNDKKTIQSSVSTIVSSASAVSASVTKANQAVKNVETVISQMPTEYVKTETFNALEERVRDLEDDDNDLTDAINIALTQAKESGEFDGADGHTPVRGTDYWTDTDVQYIVTSAVSNVLKNVAPQIIQFENGKLYAPATTAKYSPTSITDDGIVFNYRGGSGVEEIIYPITGLFVGRTYTIAFDETYNGGFIGDNYRYGCGIIQKDTYESMTFPSAVAQPSYIQWHTGVAGKQNGTINFTPTSDTVYWVWNLGRLSDGVDVSIAINGRVY